VLINTKAHRLAGMVSYPITCFSPQYELSSQLHNQTLQHLPATTITKHVTTTNRDKQQEFREIKCMKKMHLTYEKCMKDKTHIKVKQIAHPIQ